jgi:hypothetical protein
MAATTDDVLALICLVRVTDDSFCHAVLAFDDILVAALLVEAVPFPLVVGTSSTLFSPCGLL